VLGAAGKLLDANRAVLEHYRWTTEFVEASEFEGLVRDIAHPDDVETFLAGCARGFAGSSEWELAARSRRRDGVYRWFLVRATPLRDNAGHIVRWYVTGTDIDDRKKAEDKPVRLPRDRETPAAAGDRSRANALKIFAKLEAGGIEPRSAGARRREAADLVRFPVQQLLACAGQSEPS
jgi:PAS domain S-box-containing protein